MRVGCRMGWAAARSGCPWNAVHARGDVHGRRYSQTARRAGSAKQDASVALVHNVAGNAGRWPTDTSSVPRSHGLRSSKGCGQVLHFLLAAVNRWIDFQTLPVNEIFLTILKFGEGNSLIPERYVTEFDFRYNYRVALGVNDEQRADLLLKGAVGKRLTYETTAQ